jgi:hypothetical protein
VPDYWVQAAGFVPALLLLRSDDFTRGRRLVRLPAIGRHLRPPRLARWEPPRGVPVSSRRGLVTSLGVGGPWLISSRQPTGRLGREEREPQA